MEYFEHEFPIEPSTMTRGRKRIKEAGCEKLLEELIKAGLKLKVISGEDTDRVNVDTTVQEKAIAYPTDARLYYKVIRYLVRYAKKKEIRLKQTYERVGKTSLLMYTRYAHSGKMRKAMKEVSRLKRYLGRLYRDIERKTSGEFKKDDKYGNTIKLIERLIKQEKTDKNKLYSINAPEVECIVKGKSHKKYEFGCKVGIVSSARNSFILGIKAFHGNPFDGHTLKESLEQVKKITGKYFQIKYAVTDDGYKGHDYKG